MREGRGVGITYEGRGEEFNTEGGQEGMGVMVGCLLRNVLRWNGVEFMFCFGVAHVRVETSRDETCLYEGSGYFVEGVMWSI